MKPSSAKSEQWITRWMQSVVAQGSSMSQRRLSSIARHGGLPAVRRAARAAGVHLVLLTDERGIQLVAASREKFRVLC